MRIFELTIQKKINNTNRSNKSTNKDRNIKNQAQIRKDKAIEYAAE